MFDIFATNIVNASYELQRMTGSWSSRIQDVQRVEMILSEFSGMDDIITQLKLIRSLLDEDTHKLSVFTQATDKIVNLYVSAEERVIDYSDGNTVIHSYPAISAKSFFEAEKVNTLQIGCKIL